MKNANNQLISHYTRAFPLVIFLISSVYGFTTDMIVPGGDWKDTEGNVICATEGGIIKVKNLFYLWGMDRTANNYEFVAINLYSSSDLKNWKLVNKILKHTSHPDLDNKSVVERAKILSNPTTGKCVMWMHFEGLNAYKTAEVGLATCDSISGNYTFVKHFRPMNIDSRDINVYQDDDGKGYLICTTEGNQSVSLFELDASYTNIVREIYRGSAANDMECEGHAIIKTGGYYFWLMSWCTGWDFNDNHYFYSKTLGGPWTSGGNIAVTNTHTYESQVGFAITIAGSNKTSWLYTGDRWSTNNFGMSRIVLLPIEVTGTKLVTPWCDQFDINTQTGDYHYGSRNFIDGIYSIKVKHSGLVLGTSGTAVQQQNYTAGDNQLWRIQNVGASHFKISTVSNNNVFDVSEASREPGAKLLNYGWNDGYNQKWDIIDCGNGFHRFINVNTLGKSLEISGSSTAAGTDVVLGNFAYKDHQLFSLSRISEDFESGKTYMIVNIASNKALTAPTGQSSSCMQTTQAQQSVQIWRLQDLNNGYFSLTNTGTGNLLDNNFKPENMSVISTAPSNGRFSQQWQPVSIGNGIYKIINRYSGKNIDNKDGSSEDGNAIVQYTDYASENKNQQWKFVPATPAVTVHLSSGMHIKTPVTNGEIIYNLYGQKVSVRGILTKDISHSCLPTGIYLIKSTSGAVTNLYLKAR